MGIPNTMKVLVIGSGASISTKDVENGIYEALQRAGIDTKIYLLDVRLSNAYDWLVHNWENNEEVQPRPVWADAIYRGSVEALELALRYDVDWILMISGMYFHPDVVTLMRRAHLHTAVLLTESPYMDQQQQNFVLEVDGAWTNEITSIPILQEANPNIQYMRHAYDPLLHHPATEEDIEANEMPAYDVVMVGSGFEERIDLLEQVDWTGINLGLYGHWELLSEHSPLQPFLKGELISNRKTTQLYARAKLGLNIYRTSKFYELGGEHIKGAKSMNPRAYELAACQIPAIANFRQEQEDTLGDGVTQFTDAKS